MIRISQIDSDLSIYKNNTVVLLTRGVDQDLFKLLEYNNLNSKYICDADKENWGKIIKDKLVISPKQLEHIIKINNLSDKVVVQICSKTIGKPLIERINSFGITKIISHEEASTILKILGFTSLYQSDPLNPYFSHKPSNNVNNKIPVNYILKTEEISPIFIAQTQKTGDMTIKSTLQKYNIPHYFTNHNPNFFDKELFKDKTIKITTAIRDPIAKLFSNTYQDLNPNTFKSIYEITKNEYNFFANGGDAQLLFELMIKHSANSSHVNASLFMERLKENIIDLSKYPFDKEKGYTIVKEGNIEVFVYQLERMNDIVKEMSDWIGQTPFDEWKIANEASNKWIADSYNQAKKEITFSQEYFDRCYNDKWIQHFYSQEDIEKFKERWRSHIR